MPAPVTPVVTVVVVTWNAASLIRPCLDALTGGQPVPGGSAVLVIDNASTDQTTAVLAEYRGVTVVRSPRNVGFAGGVGLALRRVSTPFVVLVNNDAVPAPDAVAALVAAATAPGRDRVGAITGHVVLADRFEPVDDADGAENVDGPDDSRSLRTAGGVLVRPSPEGRLDVVNSTGSIVRTDGFGQDRDWLVIDEGARRAGPVFGFTGAFALLRTAAVADVGGIDPAYFLYYEDTDLSWRLRLGGWQIHYEPSAVARHRHAASSEEGSSLFRFHDDRNRLLTLTKNASIGLALRTVLRYPATAASIVVHTADRKAAAAVRLRVMASYLASLPRTLRQRREIGRLARQRGIRRRDVEQMLEPPPDEATGGYRLS